MAHEMTRRDPERIYLEPWPYSPEGRMWCEDDVWPLYTWPPEPNGESERATGVEYIRADLHAAEIARLTRELEEARALLQQYQRLVVFADSVARARGDACGLCDALGRDDQPYQSHRAADLIAEAERALTARTTTTEGER